MERGFLEASIVCIGDELVDSNGYTWHHLEDGKGMLLVDSKIHGGFHHSGGASALRGN